MRKLLVCLTAILFSIGQLLAQKVISGKVTDDKGNPVPNASVTVKGSSVGTTTNETGNYSLTVPQNATTLVISSIGMSDREVTIGASSTIDATLTSNVTSLSEVIVTVPYGTVKKTSFTGSEATITAATIQKQQVTSVTRALEGLVPGLMATNGGGAPGTGADIRIRGFGSLEASNSPLFVLNGVPYDGSIAALSNDDIESITVLKDATAATLYGSRAANGVIMITTKKGKKGRPNTTFTLRQGVMSRGIPEYDRVSEKEYYELFWEAYRNSYVAQGDNPTLAGQKASDVLTGPNGLVYNAYNVPGTSLVDPVTGKLDPNAKLLWDESWEDELFRNASRTNANVALSGATDITDYYLSAGYLNEQGIVKNSNYRRYNLRLNLNVNPVSWFSAGVNLDGAMAERKDVPSGGTSTTNPFYFTRQMGPIYPVYQHDPVTGAFIDTLGEHKLDWGVPEQMGTRPYAGRSNLVGSLALDDRSRDIFNGNANTYAEIRFLKNFTFKATLGINYLSNAITNYQNNQFGDAAPSTPGGVDGGRSTKTNDKQFSLTGNQVLSWRKDFGDHNFRVLAGHENYKYKYSVLSANSSGFVFPGYTDLDMGAGPFGPASSRTDNHRIESYFGNISYDFDQKYLVSASLRTDGSSRFADSVRWGTFFSFGVGWRISQEEFLRNIPWINELKLKASYGENGNENIGRFYQYINYYQGDGAGSVTNPATRANPSLLWEKNIPINVGVDFALFRNRVSGTIEWFHRESSDLIFDVKIPPSLSSGGTILRNIGVMKNSGIELQLGYNAIASRNFNWRIDVNLSHFKNKITKMPPGAVSERGIISGFHKLLVGHDRYDFWLPEFAGVDASNGDALYYKDVLDTDGKPTGERVLTNVYNQATYYYHGSAIPDISGGVNNSFNYKGFDLSFLVTFSYGGKFYDGNYASIMHRGSAGTHLHADALKRWQNPGDVTVVPRLQNAIGGQDGASSRWLVDGSWLNIKNITLSYTFPKTVLNRLQVNGLQVFANVDNAWLFTAKKGMDPQRSFTGTADATYTPFRTFNVGFSLNL